MADATWGVKVSDELKEKLQEIIKSDFNSSKEFIEQLVNLYELDKAKQDSNIFSDEVDELEGLTRRINNIFINANAKVKSLIEDKDIKFGESIQIKESLIGTLQQRISQLKNENDELLVSNDELVNLKNEYLQRVNELTESNSNIKALVEEYKEKNDMLTGLLKQYEKYPERLENIKELLSTTQAREVEKDSIIKDRDYVIRDLTAKLEELKTEKEGTINQLKSTHKEALDEINSRHLVDLQNAKDKAELEKDRAILKLRSDHQVELQQLQDKHAKDIEEYQDKYKSLLHELEQSRKVKPQTKEITNAIGKK